MFTALTNGGPLAEPRWSATTTMRGKSRAGDLVAPEIFKTRWRQLSVEHGVLDILVPKVVLD